MLNVLITDGTGSITLTWFHARKEWQKSFPTGKTVTAFGEIQHYQGPQMVAPDYEVGVAPENSGKFGAILPIYPLTEGLTQRLMRQFTRQAINIGGGAVTELLPPQVIVEKDLPPITKALCEVHFPDNFASAERAKRRLAYEELLIFQCALALHRTALKQKQGYSFKIGANVDRRIRRLFPFDFTDSQNKVAAEIRRDMRSTRPMNRLLQGDVGCGKTVIALYAMLGALAESSKHYQVALMAPTEVLAEQHYLTLEAALEKARVRTLLLKGSRPQSQRRRDIEKVKRGEIDLVVGTHALIQRDVEFNNLALVVIDEQHRFGVRQRLELQQKGRSPDVLIMTATPIPRTLAIACFGDMDVSTIDEMPPGRGEVNTHLLRQGNSRQAFEKAHEELEKGRQVFIIYPLVEENEELDLTSATEGFEELKSTQFADFGCCLMHGRMSPDEKKKAMAGFRNGRYQVMVATTVIEVGIDVPEATVMIINHAERLGLSQLHQLRGRIGRGGQTGWCFLLADPQTDEARKRLQVIAETSDGFAIAEADLRIRGPGELFGTRQSGMPEFKCYDFSDMQLLEETKHDAFQLIQKHPHLEKAEHAELRKAIKRRYADRFILGRIG